MAESFKFPTGIRPLTLGNSFKNNEEFCTIRYDFGPGTETIEEAPTLTITDSDQVTLTAHSSSNETNASQMQYKGSVKPYEKECVLIVNNLTGEIRLEKLSRNIQLKKTRLVQNEKHSKRRTQKDSPSPKQSPDNKNPVNVGLTSPKPNYRDGDVSLLGASTNNSMFVSEDSSDSSNDESATSTSKFDSLFPEMKESKQQLKSSELATAMHNSMGAPISDLSGSSSGDSSDSENDSSSSSSSSPSISAGKINKQPPQKTDCQNGNRSPFLILDDDLKLSESESDD